LRARPEQAQLQDLSDASFLGKLLVLPANVRLDWKGIVRYKHSSLFGLIIGNEEKKFYNIGPWTVFGSLVGRSESWTGIKFVNAASQKTETVTCTIEKDIF
jgi:hypothetical protein